MIFGLWSEQFPAERRGSGAASLWPPPAEERGAGSKIRAAQRKGSGDWGGGS